MPGGRQLAVVLSGWREQGLQIVDLQSRKVTQTLTQPAAFYGGQIFDSFQIVAPTAAPAAPAAPAPATTTTTTTTL